MDDYALWKEVVAGDENAYKKLFYRYHTLLVNAAFSYVRDEETAKDIAQNLFVKIWQQRRDLKIHTSLRAYLMRSIRNSSINELKKKKPLSIENTLEITDQAPDGQAQLQLADQKRLVQKAIDQMPEACRNVFLLRRMEGLALKEIANELNISPKTVENQLTKAHRILKQYIKPILVGIYLFYHLL